jgi:hypothetical protein
VISLSVITSPGAKSVFVAQTITVRFASFAIKEAHISEIMKRDAPIASLEFLSRLMFEICILSFSICFDIENHPFG